MAMTTGATDEQIEDATKRFYDLVPESDWHEDGFNKPSWAQLDQPNRRAWLQETEAQAQHLVPPDHRIVSVADLEWITNELELCNDGREGDYQAVVIDRIRALIGVNA